MNEYQDPASNFALGVKVPISEDRRPANMGVYQSFGSCFKLPVWENTMCHTRESSRFDRQVSWQVITEKFGITRLELEHIQEIFKESTYGWSTEYGAVLLGNKNKARIINTLVKKEVIKVLEGFIIINPSILIGRVGWSPFLQGVLLVQWLNERLITPRCPEEWERKSIKIGAQWAASDQPRYSIPTKVVGRVQGSLLN